MCCNDHVLIGCWHDVYRGMILVSEIGDKTFFIAAIMAMKHPRVTVRHAPPWQLLREARC